MEKPKYKENSWTCPVCKRNPYKGKADCVSLSLKGGRSVRWCSCGVVSIEDYNESTSWIKIVYNFGKE